MPGLISSRLFNQVIAGASFCQYLKHLSLIVKTINITSSSLVGLIDSVVFSWKSLLSLSLIQYNERENSVYFKIKDAFVKKDAAAWRFVSQKLIMGYAPQRMPPLPNVCVDYINEISYHPPYYYSLPYEFP